MKALNNTRTILSAVVAIVFVTSSVIFAIESRYATKKEANLGYYTLTKTILESDKRRLHNEIDVLDSILKDMADSDPIKREMRKQIRDSKTDLEELQSDLDVTVDILKELKK